ncbi:MAG: hypothetical protein WAT92_21800 [Saprospiraceae bacterium]
MKIKYVNLEVLNKKENVICDTMIWYHFGEGTINRTLVNEYYFIGTSINAFELYSSENILYHYPLFRRAVKAFNSNSCAIINMDPFDYMLSQNTIESSLVYDLGSSVLEALSKYIQTDLSIPLQDNIVRNIIAQEIQEVNEPALNFVNEIIENINDLRVKYAGSKNEINAFKLSNSIESCKRMFIKVFESRHFDFSNFDINNCELFIKMFDLFIRTLIIDKGLKIEINDIYDLTNMAFVDRNSKYLTCENKWKDFAKRINLYDKYFLDDSKFIIKK